jgi:hypothetical protein
MPMMTQPVYLAPSQGYPVEYAPAPWANQPAQWSGPAQPQAAPASFVSAPPRAPASRPVFRAKGADDPPASPRPANTGTATLTIPPPEQLGISLAPQADTPSPNWVQAHRELERLAAVSYRLDKVSEGGCRFICLLPTSQPGFTHRVEAEAATEAEAVRMVLDKAREWSAAK